MVAFNRTLLACICLSLLLLCAENLAAQGRLRSIQGSVQVDGAVPLTGSYIKISCCGKTGILSYFNTGNTSFFTAEIPLNDADSFTITATHIGYRDAVYSLLAGAGTTIDVKIKMEVQSAALDSVMVKAPAVWVRGDTTFFRKEAFAEGDEKKLKDIIKKMPGFDIDDNGNLLYKRRHVDKIMMDGEELFSDKIKLLLQNFPSYAIHTIQAIENQNRSRVTKGIADEGKVFVNLGLDKTKIKATFGDGEAGLSNTGRYFIKPVLFTLSRKIKLGVVADWNNVGDGLEWRLENELKSDDTKESEAWMMDTRSLQLINNFDIRRYISNRQLNTNIQVNTPINKALKAQTEINISSDKQTQALFKTLSLYSDTGFISRRDTSRAVFQPLVTSVKYTLNNTTDSLKEWKAVFSWLHNGSAASQQFIIAQQNQRNNVDSRINNGFNSFQVQVERNIRRTPQKAVLTSFAVAVQDFPQEEWGSSDAWFSSFQLPDPGYTIRAQRLEGFFVKGNGRVEWVKKTQKGLLNSFALIGKWSLANMQTNMNFMNKAGAQITLRPFQNTGKYQVRQLVGEKGVGFRLLGLPFTMSGTMGLGAVSMKENGVEKSFVLPVFQAQLSQKKKFSRYFSGQFDVTASQQIQPEERLHQILLPKSTLSIQQHKNISKPHQMAAANYVIGYSIPQARIISYLSFSYTRRLTAALPSVSYSSFVQTSADSIVNSSLNSFSISSNSTYPSLLLNALFDIRGSFSISEFLLNSGTQLLEGKMKYYTVALGMKKNWQKKFFLHWIATFYNSSRTMPASFQSNVASDVSNLRLLFNQRLLVKKQLSFLWEMELHHNNINSPSETSLLYSSASCNYVFKNKPFSVGLKLENIGNERYYVSMNNAPLVQSFYEMPLVKRNLLLSVRYEL